MSNYSELYFFRKEFFTMKDEIVFGNINDIVDDVLEYCYLEDKSDDIVFFKMIMHIKGMWYDNEKSVPYFIVDAFEISDDFIEYKKDLRIDKSTISKAKKISRTLGKIGRGISRFKETGVFRFVYNILDKLANKIVPLEISDKYNK